jgi:hypothetical protein
MVPILIRHDASHWNSEDKHDKQHAWCSLYSSWCNHESATTLYPQHVHQKQVDANLIQTNENRCSYSQREKSKQLLSFSTSSTNHDGSRGISEISNVILGTFNTMQLCQASDRQFTWTGTIMQNKSEDFFILDPEHSNTRLHQSDKLPSEGTTRTSKLKSQQHLDNRTKKRRPGIHT